MTRRICVACIFFVSVFVCASALPAVTGTKVSNVSVLGDDVMITIANDTPHAVTAWTIEITGLEADGKPLRWQHGQDYGPPSLNESHLKPGEHVDYIGKLPPGGVNYLKARVVLAIYDDQTAEVADENAFNQAIRAREVLARSFSVSAEIFKNASLDKAPRERAKHDLDAELSKIGTELTKTNQRQMLEHSESMIDSTPPGNDGEFVRQQAEYDSVHAAAFAHFAEVRRVQ